jgi:hypothetical protein
MMDFVVLRHDGDPGLTGTSMQAPLVGVSSSSPGLIKKAVDLAAKVLGHE